MLLTDQNAALQAGTAPGWHVGVDCIDPWASFRRCRGSTVSTQNRVQSAPTIAAWAHSCSRGRLHRPIYKRAQRPNGIWVMPFGLAAAVFPIRPYNSPNPPLQYRRVPSLRCRRDPMVIVFFVLSCLIQPVWATISVSNTTPMQGETVEATYAPNGADKIVDHKTSQFFSFNHNTYKLFPTESGNFHCLIAMPADLTPGKYSITFGDEDCPITVKNAKFPVEHLSLPKTKDNFIMSPGEEQAMNTAKATLSNQRLWDGHFIKPCQAKISAVFGIRRIVNHKLLKDYYHSGVDFAGNLGQPVKACADGKVVLAHRNFKLHGNVIAIDHGQGVVTIYIHLQKIMAKEGDCVKAGQQIGAVGATGRANGPHLHLSLYVNQVAANPLPWFSKTF